MPLQSFTTWLTENQKQRIQFAGWFKDGTVIVYLNGIRHVYITDAIYHERWKALSKRNPMLVMSQIAQLVRAGHAQQTEPPSVSRKPIQPPNPKPVIKQPSLFDNEDDQENDHQHTL